MVILPPYRFNSKTLKFANINTKVIMTFKRFKFPSLSGLSLLCIGCTMKTHLDRPVNQTFT